MSQNCSKMSDIYIPELLELDAYWQKAVEDAIYDTLKGEKRLCLALRNRKKINNKLKKLGLKSSRTSHKNFTKHRCSNSKYYQSLAGNNKFSCGKYESNMDMDSFDDNSLGTSQNEDLRSQKISKRGRTSFSPVRSSSRSKNGKETPPEKIYRNPERPVLGNGSLEKMKKSQNSFYCEAMGAEETLISNNINDNSFQAKEKNVKKSVDLKDGKDQGEDKNKKIEWLYFRENKIFEDSDTDISNKESPNKKNFKTAIIEKIIKIL